MQIASIGKVCATILFILAVVFWATGSLTPVIAGLFALAALGILFG